MTDQLMSDTANPMLLDSYLKQLRLPGFLNHWRSFAVDAANSNLSYDRFLLALAEQEVPEGNRTDESSVLSQPIFQ